MGDDALAWLAAAGVPAFLCQRAGERIEIDDRTAAFTAAVDARTGLLDETWLLAQLPAVWPASRSSHAVAPLAGLPDVHCVLQALDEPPTRCVGILRFSTLAQRDNDTFFTTVEALPDVVARLDRNHRHVYINPTIERFTGLSPQQMIGRSKREIGLPPQLVEVWEPLVDKVFDTGEPAEQEDVLPTVHGPRHFLTRVVPEFRSDGAFHTVLSTSHDITGLKELQWQLELLARTDPLTSLMNRRGFMERVETELLRVGRREGRLSLLVLDVNDFKAINDSFGHAAGDSVLIAIGHVLQEETRDDDFAARLGGDEFCVGLVDVDDAHAASVVDRIRLRVDALGVGDGCPCAVSLSIGLASAGEHDHSVSDLLNRVDQLMYREKPRGRDRS